MASKNPMDALHRLVAAHGTQTAAARALGISQPYLHDLLHGNRNFSARMLAQLGLERVERIIERKGAA
jgi:plasmid maintenance system antidote protein VapI